MHRPSTIARRRGHLVLGVVLAVAVAAGGIATVGQAAGGSPVVAQNDSGVDLEEPTPNVTQGGIADVAVDVPAEYGGSDGEFGLVVSQAGTDRGYELNASVPANATAIHFNTYAAGHSHRTNVSASDVVWAEAPDGAELAVTIRTETALEGILTAGAEYDLQLGADLTAAHRDPDAVGSLSVEERDPAENSMRLLRAPRDTSLATVAEITGARENGTLTGADGLVEDRAERLVLEIELPGQTGLYRTVGGATATDRLRNLLANDSVALEIQQVTADGVAPSEVDLEESWSSVHAIEHVEEGRLYVVVDLAAAEIRHPTPERAGSVENGDDWAATYALSGRHLLNGSGTAPLSGSVADGGEFETVEGAVAIRAENTSFAAEPYDLPPVAVADVRGNTTLAPGTTGRVVVNATESAGEYRFVEPVTVGRNGTFRASFDLRNATAGDGFVLRARGGLNASTSGEILGSDGAPIFHFLASAPDAVNASEPARLEVVIQNAGSGRGTAQYTIEVDGTQVEAGNVTLEAGENATVTHGVDTGQVGDVEWSVRVEGSGDEGGRLAVEKPAQVAPSEAIAHTRSTSRDTPASGDERRGDREERSRFGLVVAVAILVGGLFASVFWLTSGDW